MTNINQLDTEVVVIGSGPGGYTAAFRAADLGKKVILIEEHNIGGVCLNKGCIPSKALLNISHLIDDTKKSESMGLSFSSPKLDFKKINKWKNNIIKNLSNGIESLADKRNVKIVNGYAKFLSANRLIVTDNQNKQLVIKFLDCIIATGSSPIMLEHLYTNSAKILDSTDALDINNIPKNLLIIGGGYIGLELGSVYHSLGSKITIAEFLPELLSMADKDLVKPLFKKLNNNFKNIYLSTEVIKIDHVDNKVIAHLKNNAKTFTEPFDAILICVGRKPNTSNLDLDKAGIKTDENGIIKVNSQRRTMIPNIYAIGDITGNPMLAHKATHEAHVASENIAGNLLSFDPIAIPSVIYTNPEVAWVGETEAQLNKKNIKYNKAVFPWSANGRALSIENHDGKTKLITSKDNSKILGIGIVGSNAGELINEAILAMEMGANTEDLGLTIHAHPTLSETLSNCAEILNGTITDLYIPK